MHRPVRTLTIVSDGASLAGQSLVASPYHGSTVKASWACLLGVRVAFFILDVAPKACRTVGSAACSRQHLAIPTDDSRVALLAVAHLQAVDGKGVRVRAIGANRLAEVGAVS